MVLVVKEGSATGMLVIDPRHCELRERCTHTHFGLEVHSPTLKVIWESGNFREQIPELPSYNCLRISSSSTMHKIPGVMIPGKSRSRYC